MSTNVPLSEASLPFPQPSTSPSSPNLPAQKNRFLEYVRHPQFWIVLALSQALAITQTGTNTLTTLLANQNVSIPAFQSLFVYIALFLIYGTITICKVTPLGYLRILKTDGWKYLLLAIFDSEGNFFTVLAYRNTTILSAQLLNFWAIAVVMIISLGVLKVRYHIAQYAGILLACGGLGILVASDHMTHSNGGKAKDAVKGDLFCLVGATCYGLANVFEEFLLSKKPVYEVVGQLGFWGMVIMGVQASVFDREHLERIKWTGDEVGYLVGFTVLLVVFYTGAPLVFRMASAAFFNIGLLTGNFWGVIVGLKVFHLRVHYLYPVAFVLIIVGHFVYYGTEGVLGEAKKPWLGEEQEEGISGIGTAKRRLRNPQAVV
ncbi:DUF914-domain-containing protein [Piedraia hortae CBS 480.64]|uniref:DUF914-domain-containing protein n=1 Tax=Piedraia hortae CBS 480.64 TaxID=1314780 RepID=A0A6A7C2D4_9PEZI|nr:DUF914-domain-containing protein [Piedraia hortae CBS 480.64]